MKKISPLFLFLLIAPSVYSQKNFADKIYFNANIWTGDVANPTARVIAIKGNTIIYVGDNYKPYKSPGTAIIDLKGK